MVKALELGYNRMLIWSSSKGLSTSHDVTGSIFSLKFSACDGPKSLT